MTDGNEDDVVRGSITTEFTVWCCSPCVCWHQESARNRAQAARLFKRQGWRYTRRRGWLCPACVAPPTHGGLRYHGHCGGGTSSRLD